MKRFFGILVALAILFFPLVAMSQDSKEVLTLKRDLAQERIVRVQTQMTLMQQQFKEGQQVLQASQKELEELNGKLKAMEPKKEDPKKPEKKEK